MKDLLDNWPILFGTQRILQVAFPYVYILLLEFCVGLTFSLALVFMGASTNQPYV